MVDTLVVVQIVISVLMVISILLQSPKEGAGSLFGTMTGGESFRTRRGLEKLLYNGTIVLSIAFVVTAILIAKYS